MPANDRKIPSQSVERNGSRIVDRGEHAVSLPLDAIEMNPRAVKILE